MAGNPVLLLHGFTTSARRTWAEPGWIELLTEAGREVIAPDLLGHGQAAKPHDPAAYRDLEQQITDVLPDSPIDGIGYSAGARILLTLAAAEPGRFGRLVVGGVGATMLEPRERSPILDALLGSDDGDDGGGDPVAQHFRALASTDGNDLDALVAFLQRETPALGPNELGQITNDVLVVLGDQDFAGPGEPLAEALPAGQLVTLRGVDHFGLPKAFPFIEQALDFLGAAPF